MLDKRFIRENPDKVKAAVRVKGIGLDVDELLEADQASRKLQHELDQAQARRKSSAKEFAKADEARRAELRAEHEDLDALLKTLRDQLAETSKKLTALLLMTPTIPWEGAPVGPDESANVVIRTHGTPPEFDFKPVKSEMIIGDDRFIDVRQGRNPSTGSMLPHGLIRPFFQSWRAEIHVEVDPFVMDDDALRGAFNAAGRQVGIGSWRPSSPSPAISDAARPLLR